MLLEMRMLAKERLRSVAQKYRKKITKHNCKFLDWIFIMINQQRYGKLYWHVDDRETYLEFQNQKEARTWGIEHYKNWADKYKRVMQMSKSAIKGSLCEIPIECYCGYSYRQINEFLRYEKDDDYHTYRELADILSIVLCSAPRIPHNLVLYRMVNDEFINMLIEKNKQELPTPMQEKGFMSTSLLKNIANETESYVSQNNLLKIFVPKDTIGVYVNAVTSRSEEEMLLFPNMYLGLVSYPHKDEDTGKILFECQLIKMY